MIIVACRTTVAYNNPDDTSVGKCQSFGVVESITFFWCNVNLHICREVEFVFINHQSFFLWFNFTLGEKCMYFSNFLLLFSESVFSCGFLRRWTIQHALRGSCPFNRLIENTKPLLKQILTGAGGKKVEVGEESETSRVWDEDLDVYLRAVSGAVRSAAETHFAGSK